jgi:hypothetical protein
MPLSWKASIRGPPTFEASLSRERRNKLMYDAGKIFIGLAVFLFVLASPVLYNHLSGKADYTPELEYPEGEERCIESKDYMTAYHMDMLNTWRDSVVRDGNRIYVAEDGKQYNMSLTNTCLNCHTSRAQFCDKCHNYAAVDPYCWDCHIHGEEKR